jgi:hypothetical protein
MNMNMKNMFSFLATHRQYDNQPFQLLLSARTNILIK